MMSRAVYKMMLIRRPKTVADEGKSENKGSSKGAFGQVSVYCYCCYMEYLL